MTKEQLFGKENEEVIPYDSISHLIVGVQVVEDMSIYQLTTKMFFKDHRGAFRMCVGLGRNDYKVATGLYTLGNPNEKSKVFVTSNYKLTFDKLRSSLKDISCYILVLDTNGINVWCAAGKGTFSSRELIYQLNKWKLKKALGIRSVILPQLGAANMEPHLVRKHVGITVTYGPVRAEDLPQYVANDYQADEEMRKVTFTLKERLVLSPLEALHYAKYIAYIAVIALAMEILNDFLGKGFLIEELIQIVLLFALGNITATFLFSALLPVLPFKRFSFNGILLSVPFGVWMSFDLYHGSVLSTIGYWLLLMNYMAYITFSFTGSTPFTSQSGVAIENRLYSKLAPMCLGIGGILVILGVFI